MFAILGGVVAGFRGQAPRPPASGKRQCMWRMMQSDRRRCLVAHLWFQGSRATRAVPCSGSTVLTPAGRPDGKIERMHRCMGPD